MRRAFDDYAIPEPMSASDRSELCRICHRRRGEHYGKTGKECPGHPGQERPTHFDPSGRYGKESPDMVSRWLEWEQRRLGRTPAYRRLTAPDRMTGAPKTDGWELADFVDVRR